MGIERESNFGLKEIESSKYTNVLANLLDIYGEKVGSTLVDRCADDFERVIILGEPSGGKTTIVAQLAYALNKRLKPVKSFVFYDNVLRRVEGKILERDPEIISREMWTEADWALLDDSIASAVRATEGERALIEIPGVSNKYGIRTRGRNAIKEIVKNSDDILVVYNIADPSTQIWGANARQTILETPDEQVFDVMRNKFHAEIEGITESPTQAARLKSAMRWAAAREHINAIDDEMMDMVAKWSLQEQNFKKIDDIKLEVVDAYSYEEVLSGVSNSEAQIKKLLETATDKVKRKAAFAVDYLKDILDVGEFNGMVIFNPFVRGAKIKVDVSVFNAK